MANDLTTRPIDDKLRGRAFASKEDMDELRCACREYNVSDRTKLMLARLVSYPPAVRLAVNLKTVVGLMVNGPIYSVLTEGLLPEERAALVELDLCGLPSHAREIAHGLMNIHERWLMMKTARHMFKEAQKAKDEYLVPSETGGNSSEG